MSVLFLQQLFNQPNIATDTRIETNEIPSIMLQFSQPTFSKNKNFECSHLKYL